MLCLALILMLGIGVSRESCPKMCQCENYPRNDMPKNSLYYTLVTCDDYKANITINQLDNTTRQFRICNLNKDDVLSVLEDLEDRKSDLPQLSELTITKSELLFHANDSAIDLDWIRSLTLTDNELQVLPHLFSNLTALQMMDLSRNRLETIQQEAFKTLTSLEMLNLSANALSDISNGVFYGLHKLKCLDLSRNNITSLNNNVLSGLSSLQRLNLSRNHLETLNEACFGRLIGLQQLDVSWNRLSRVSAGSLELPSLSRLLLTGNTQLGNARDAAVLVGTGHKLQTVDASQTGLKQVPAALTHSIRSLSLAENHIRSVNCGDLDSYPLLQLLDLTSNRLAMVEEDAMGRLDSLSVLYLTHNTISELPKSLPEKLKALHVEHNVVAKVSGKDLQGLTVLEVLLLNDNNISIIEEGAFSHLISLATLDLSGNPLVILQPGSLTGPLALRILRLASIRIASPAEENTFPISTPDNLITLDLCDSPGLARQLLADTATLAASKQLQELDLSRTNLEYVRSDLLHFLPQLRALHLKDNRLNCSQLHWLGVWLRQQESQEYRDVICSSPPDVWGIPLVDLQVEEEASTNPKIDDEAIDRRRKLKKKNIEKLGEENDLFKTNKSSIISTTSPYPGEQTLTAPFPATKVDIVAVNETGKAAITASSILSQSTDYELTAQNANETAESSSNRAGDTFISKFSRDLLVARDEKTFNDDKSQKSSVVHAKSIDSQPLLNTNDKDDDDGVLIAVVIVAILSVAVVATFTVHFVRSRRSCGNRVVEDIEVASLPTVTDLW